MVYREKTAKTRTIRKAGYSSTLCHFNPYHDPDNGQFTEPSGSSKKRLVATGSNKSSTKPSNKNDGAADTATSSAAAQDQTKNSTNNTNRDKIKKALKIGGIALGSALVVLGARYLIDDAVQTYAKRHIDTVLNAGQILSTLSFDPDRTKGVDMMYATHQKRDMTFYGAFFNTPIHELLDKNGNIIGRGTFLKKQIKNTTIDPIRVASEDSGARVFIKLFRNDPDFSDFVLNPEKMLKRFDAAPNNPRRFKGYRDSIRILERIKNSDNVSNSDLAKIYRLFNFVIPNTDEATISQRAKFFNALYNAGFGAVLDTNDLIYGGFHARSPVIVFDMAKIVPSQIYQTTMKDRKLNILKALTNKVLGTNL